MRPLRAALILDHLPKRCSCPIAAIIKLPLLLNLSPLMNPIKGISIIGAIAVCVLYVFHNLKNPLLLLLIQRF